MAGISEADVNDAPDLRGGSVASGAEDVASNAQQHDDDQDEEIEEEQPPPPMINPGDGPRAREKSNYCCGPCTVRNSRCDRYLPSCGPCVQQGTVDQCFAAAGRPIAPVIPARRGRRGNQQPPPPPRPADPIPDAPRTPEARSRRTSAAPTIRSGTRPITITSRSASPPMNRPASSVCSRSPALSMVGDRGSVQAPALPRGSAARATAAAELELALAQLAQARANLNAAELFEAHTMLLHRAFYCLASHTAPMARTLAGYGTGLWPSRLASITPRISLPFIFSRIRAACPHLHTVLITVSPAHAPAAPAQPLGLNIGQFHSAQNPRPPMALGVVADANFSFVAQNIVDLFLKKNWVSHVSLVYLTDAYNKQSSLHLATTSYKTQLDPVTHETIYVAQPLPDLNESSMEFQVWERAFQRFIAILRMILNPWVERWVLHGDIIRHHPLLTVNWPLLLAYDIAIRKRSVNNPELDPGTFQYNIFEACRATQQQERFEELTRSATATIAQSRAPSSTSRTYSAPVAHKQANPRSEKAGNSGFSGRCFACGTPGHRPMDCSNPPLRAALSDEGKWVLDVTGVVKGTTSAPSAVTEDMAPKPAPKDPRRIVTPLHADAWELALADAGLLDRFSDLPIGLRCGFSFGVSSSLDSTIIYPNHKSATDRPEIIQKHIAKEVEAGRYSGPFTPDALFQLIGHFCASPLGVVDKPSSPGDFRVIQDFSYPRDDPDVSSINSEIDPLAFTSSWGFFSLVVAILLGLPPGSQAATLDVDAAYRRMPVLLKHQAYIVVHWEGQCWVDHCVPFGGASSGGIFGRCGDALLELCMSRGLGPAVKWVDDFLFFRSPVPGIMPESFPYTLEDLYELAKVLGIPWKIAKTKPFATWFLYLGFLWDIPSRRVSIPIEKRQKFANKIRKWLNSKCVSLQSTQSLLGSLIHCALALPEGRSRVVGISRFTATFSHRYQDGFNTRQRSARATEDAVWWLDRLTNGDCGSFLKPLPPRSDVKCFMDASTSFGIGIIIDNEFAFWKLKDGWESAGRDIGWAEMVAVEMTLYALILRDMHDATITFHSDNQGVIGAIRAGRSRNDQQNAVLQRIMAEALAHNIHIDIVYIPTDENPADAPSRGTAPPGLSMLDPSPTPDGSVGKWFLDLHATRPYRHRKRRRP
ncbi:hypothetical protein FRC09_013965 [Ceratobasidium sp. 395]|nr:hypothetical protein FRC09_013965 [Ceratobasidium sp. 395]